MFKDIKNKEILNQILSKLAQIDTKVSSVDKLLKEKPKSVKETENKDR